MAEDPICKSKSPRILLVEGKTDCHVIMALCGKLSVPETFGIYECGSDDNVLRRLNALLVGSLRAEIIGVVIDANTKGVSARLRHIKSKLKEYPYKVPARADENGSIISAVSIFPRLGFWIMPNNKNVGMLEDFLLKMCEQEPLEFAQASVDQAKERSLTTFKAKHRSKANLHTYLAWQDEPGRPPGQSITTLTLKADNEIGRKFAKWLEKLFTPA